MGIGCLRETVVVSPPLVFKAGFEWSFDHPDLMEGVPAHRQGSQS